MLRAAGDRRRPRPGALAAGVVHAKVVLIEARRSADNTDAQVTPIGTIDHYDQLLEGNA